MLYSQPPDPQGYAAEVLKIVRAIPPGRVMTYGGIAALIPPPPDMPPDAYLKLSPRWVGAVMARCPDDLPWQRVINSQGKVSPRPGLGPTVQRRLLEQERIVFDDKDRVDLKKYGWQPGEPEPPKQPGLL